MTASPGLDSHPLGRLIGNDLIFDRTFSAPIDDVWASITEPERVARWFGSIEGTAAVGATIHVAMPAEDGDSTWPITIAACHPPRHLRLVIGDDPGDAWDVELQLREANGITTLEFVHHLAPGTSLDQVAPGWDFYLDRLNASRDGRPLPAFAGYVAVLGPRYLGLNLDTSRTG